MVRHEHREQGRIWLFLAGYPAYLAGYAGKSVCFIPDIRPDNPSLPDIQPNLSRYPLKDKYRVENVYETKLPILCRYKYVNILLHSLIQRFYTFIFLYLIDYTEFAEIKRMGCGCSAGERTVSYFLRFFSHMYIFITIRSQSLVLRQGGMDLHTFYPDISLYFHIN